MAWHFASMNGTALNYYYTKIYKIYVKDKSLRSLKVGFLTGTLSGDTNTNAPQKFE